jgi:uncharacterized protein
MEVFAVPIEDKFLIYRPLRRLAFVGNEAMARAVMGLATRQGEVDNAVDLPPDVLAYLEKIGFLEPDLPPPPPRDPEHRPTSAVILSTNRCNLRCVYCYADAGLETGEDVPLEMAKTAIDLAHRNAVELGRSSFDLTFHGGGEPTLAWDTLVEAVAYARAKDLPCDVSVVSNGVWTERQREWLIPNLNGLTISFDGTRETQDSQRPFAPGKGSFEAVMETIRAFDEQGFRYGIRMTAMAPWQGRLVKDVEFVCRETSCRRIRVEPAYNLQRGGYRSPSPEESADFVAGFMEAYAVAEEAGRVLSYSGAKPWHLGSTFCSAPYGGIIVTPGGELVSCYEVTSSRHPLAGVCTIGRIENGRVTVDEEKRRGVLSYLAARREACRDCFCYWHCAGDCHAKTLYPGEDATPKTSTRCRVNRSITAQMLLWQIASTDDGVWRAKKKRLSDPGPGEDDVG